MLDFSRNSYLIHLLIFQSEKNGLIYVYFIAVHFSVTSSTLNGELLCGEILLGNYTSTSNSFTLHFVSDNTITARGFDVVFRSH